MRDTWLCLVLWRPQEQLCSELRPPLSGKQAQGQLPVPSEKWETSLGTLKNIQDFTPTTLGEPLGI